uniref:Uncharacterized protein n=1 Tax=Panagrolaimus sp. ES5 TaxID=591445 RepID=A0AC34FKG5_9BILA
MSRLYSNLPLVEIVEKYFERYDACEDPEEKRQMLKVVENFYIGFSESKQKITLNGLQHGVIFRVMQHCYRTTTGAGNQSKICVALLTNFFNSIKDKFTMPFSDISKLFVKENYYKFRVVYAEGFQQNTAIFTESSAIAIGNPILSGNTLISNFGLLEKAGLEASYLYGANFVNNIESYGTSVNFDLLQYSYQCQKPTLQHEETTMSYLNANKLAPEALQYLSLLHTTPKKFCDQLLPDQVLHQVTKLKCAFFPPGTKANFYITNSFITQAEDMYISCNKLPPRGIIDKNESILKKIIRDELIIGNLEIIVPETTFLTAYVAREIPTAAFAEAYNKYYK